jgi:hypothetical protein
MRPLSCRTREATRNHSGYSTNYPFSGFVSAPQTHRRISRLFQLRPRTYCQPSSKVSAETVSRVEVETNVGGNPEPEFKNESRICAGACSVVSRAADDCSEPSSIFSAATVCAPLFVAVNVPVVGFLRRRPSTPRSPTFRASPEKLDLLCGRGVLGLKIVVL